jgi:acetaldehyde dehydrogenase (acetylating)
MDGQAHIYWTNAIARIVRAYPEEMIAMLAVQALARTLRARLDDDRARKA